MNFFNEKEQIWVCWRDLEIRTKSEDGTAPFRVKN